MDDAAAGAEGGAGDGELGAFQARMAATYGERDGARGLEATVAWLAEEVGELARAVRKGDDEERLHELGDVLAWLASLANQLGLSLADAARRYAAGCPRCAASPCACPEGRRPRATAGPGPISPGAPAGPRRSAPR